MTVKEALVLCGRKDPAFGDRVVVRSGLTASTRVCSVCDAELMVSPSTIAMESRPDLRLIYACNPCGKRAAAERGVKALGIAPGALQGVTPDERRRRNELEAHGFRDLED